MEAPEESLQEKIDVLKDAFIEHLLVQQPQDDDDDDKEITAIPDDRLWEALASILTVERHADQTVLQEMKQDFTKLYFFRNHGMLSVAIAQHGFREHMESQKLPLLGYSVGPRGVAATQQESDVQQTAQDAHYWRCLCHMLQALLPKPSNNMGIIVKATNDENVMVDFWVLEKHRLLQLLANAKYMNVLTRYLILPIAKWQQQHHNPVVLRHETVYSVHNNDPLRLLPEWAQQEFDNILNNCSNPSDDDETRTKAVVDLSQKNVEIGHQEPFACLIYQHDQQTKSTIPFVLGVNHGDLHAETMALRLFQTRILKQQGDGGEIGDNTEYWMYSSCEPCCDCFGSLVLFIATLQSTFNGKYLTRLFTAATEADAESLGFDEGPINDASYQALQETFEVHVTRQLQCQKSAKVIRAYGEKMKLLESAAETERPCSFRLSDSAPNDIANRFHEDGFVVIRQAIKADLLQETWHSYANACFRQVFEILHENGYIDEPTDQIGESGIYTMGQGLKDGFAEVVMRSPGRYEISLLHLLPGNTQTATEANLPQLPDLPEDLLQPLQSLLPSLLGNGDNMKLIHLSLLVARPESSDQAWHADGPHATTSSSSDNILPCHVFNIFIPLQDTPRDMGPTELRPGSHHLTKGNLAKNMLVAKCKKTLRKPEWPELNVGDVLIFDYRVLHRGRANNMDVNRNYLVLTYAEPWFQDKLNFPKRSMYEKNK